MSVHAGFQLSCLHSHCSDHIPVLPEKDGQSTEEEEKNENGEEKGLQEKMKEEMSFVSQQEQLPTSRKIKFQGNASIPNSMPGLGGSKPGVPINHRRLFSLEPFHQSSISSSRLKRGREEEREEEDRLGSPNKKTKLTNGMNQLSTDLYGFKGVVILIFKTPPFEVLGVKDVLYFTNILFSLSVSVVQY